MIQTDVVLINQIAATDESQQLTAAGPANDGVSVTLIASGDGRRVGDHFDIKPATHELLGKKSRCRFNAADAGMEGIRAEENSCRPLNGLHDLILT